MVREAKTEKSTAKAPAKKAKSKRPLIAYRCTYPGHDHTRAWALSVAAKAHRVDVTTTAKGGARSMVIHLPVCPTCAKDSKDAAGTNRQLGTIEVEVSEL